MKLTLKCLVSTKTGIRNFRIFFFNPLSASVALIETSQLICCAHQLTGFYMRATLALNGLSESSLQC